ncbi:hypothetical protein LOC67_27010 [Stieleria sp. JC731]|uniref:hypothetical protein n=1 Tax=Stieleria sp. JC731 TaxID=2894195 RepID=UPI001E3C51BC|nr:hypothetical protein [Stieleria sp. JC731]MCC9604220.1 hypothetical protein [Stieleria sp. JC731]
MYCRHINADGLKIDDPSRDRIDELVRRYLNGELSNLSLETEEMSGIGMEFLNAPVLGYCAYGVEDSERGCFVYESFNGVESNVLKDISIYQFPESAFFSDPRPFRDVAIEFAQYGTIGRQIPWRFRSQLANDTMTPDCLLSVNDPRSVEEFLATYLPLT